MTNDAQIIQIYRSDSERIRQAADVFMSVGKTVPGKQENLRLLAREHTLFSAADDSDKICGVLLVGALDPDFADRDYNDYLRPRRIPANGTIELMDMAVSPNHRRRGLGSALVAYALECYSFSNRVVAVSRFRDCDRDSSLGLLLRNEFRILAEAKGYFLGGKFDCPDCRTSACVCSGFICLRENR